MSRYRLSITISFTRECWSHHNFIKIKKLHSLVFGQRCQKIIAIAINCCKQIMALTQTNGSASRRKLRKKNFHNNSKLNFLKYLVFLIRFWSSVFSNIHKSTQISLTRDPNQPHFRLALTIQDYLDLEILNIFLAISLKTLNYPLWPLLIPGDHVLYKLKCLLPKGAPTGFSLSDEMVFITRLWQIFLCLSNIYV